jgi:inorganic phosphate transporter, PiT family
VMIFLVLSPVIGLVLGYLIMVGVSWIGFRVERRRAERSFRHLQLFSAGAYSLGHGTNDAQKTMGIIAALLIAGGKQSWAQGHYKLFGIKHEIAWWIVLSCHAAMALGTLLGGWRIVKTIGSRITPHLKPMGGFSAEMAVQLVSVWPPLQPCLYQPRTLSPVVLQAWVLRITGVQCAGSGANASSTPGSLLFQVRR